MNLTVVIPFYNGFSTIQNLVDSIPLEIPIIIVNDRSDRSPEVQRKGNLVVHDSEIKGYFSGAVNKGITLCDSDILVLNQDVELKGTSWLDLLSEKSRKYAMIGERILGVHPAWKNGYIHGTFMFMRRDALKKVGPLNTKYYPLWGSTCEWQLRACRKGYEVLPLPTIPGFVHLRKANERFGSSIKELLTKEKINFEKLVRTPPLISVIVPSYNHGPYLRDLINSFIGGPTSLGVTPGQTLQSFEMIIADDCSTDNTESLMEELADPWKGIHYVKTAVNGGTSAASNLAIKNAFGKVIYRIDADDMADPQTLEKLYDALAEDFHSFVYTDVQIFTGSVRHPKIWKIPDYDLSETMHRNQVPAGIMFTKEAWKEVGGYPEEMKYGRDDWAMNISMGVHGYCGVHVAYPGYLYRREGQNRTLTNTSPAWRKKFEDQLKALFPDLYGGKVKMGCCGGSKSRVGRAGARIGGTRTMSTIPGSSGMTLIEYTGGNSGKETYYGPSTGTRYVFSNKENVKNVANEDLYVENGQGKGIGFLDMMQSSKHVFRIFLRPVEISIPEAIEEVAEEEEEYIEEKSSSEIPGFQLLDVQGIGETSLLKLEANGIYIPSDFLYFESTELSKILGWSVAKVDKAKDGIMSRIGDQV